MKHASMLAAGAALALSACQNSEEPAPDASASPATASAAPAETVAASADAVAFTAGQPPSREFFVGTWGEGDDCELPINFQPDGTIKDGPFAKWELNNGQLTMDDAVTLTLSVVDENTVESKNESSDEPTILKRCG